MATEPSSTISAQIIRLMAARLKRAHEVTAAADCCAAAGNDQGACRILMDVDQDLFEASNLLNALTVIRREQET